MTEKKLYNQLMLYKKKHGITGEMKQNYLWALETIQKNNTSQNTKENKSNTYRDL